MVLHLYRVDALLFEHQDRFGDPRLYHANVLAAAAKYALVDKDESLAHQMRVEPAFYMRLVCNRGVVATP